MFQRPYLRHNHVDPLRDDQHDPSVLPEKRQRLQRLKGVILIRENLKQRCYFFSFLFMFHIFHLIYFDSYELTFLQYFKTNIILDILFLTLFFVLRVDLRINRFQKAFSP